MPKRSFLLTLFLMFGFLPTFFLLLLGIYRQTGLCVRNYEAFAQSRLGLPMETTGIVYRTPSRGRLRGLTIFQPGTSTDGKHHPLASTPWVDWVRYKTLREGKEISLTKWTLPELVLDVQSLEPLWRTHQKVLMEFGREKNPFKSSEIFLEVEGPVKVGFHEDAQELHRVEVKIFDEKGIPQTFVRFFVPDSNREAQIQLTLRHIVQNSSQVMQATLATDTQGIPIRYLQTLFPMLQVLGTECRFTGSIIIQQSFSRWSGVFCGRFDHVDPMAFVPNQALTGNKGTLEITKARFDGARLVQAEGSFQLEQGIISRSLLERAQQLIQLQVGEWPTGNSIPFRELAFRFQMNDSQMQIFGACTGSGPGVFINGTQAPILSEASVQRKPFSRAVFIESLK